MDWKIIASLAIVMAIAFIAVSRTPEVSRFFDDIVGYINPVPGNLSFSLVGVYSENVTLATTNSAVEMTPENVSLEIGGGTIESGSHILLRGFKGNVKIHENTAYIDGIASAVEVGDASINYAGRSVKGTVGFSALKVTNVTSRSFDLNTSSGMLNAGDTEITIDGKIVTIVAPHADYSFETGSLRVAGKARRIEVPDAGLRIE
ncbi:MAG: hypothetical protein HY364_00910 [Candidatus Aenigmarchaeota archaeon]|nr:hypothetical protein [Candidatus Aenigmarchaeota archaeon]